MQDITKSLQQAATKAKRWTRGEFMSAAHAAVESIPGSVLDWDKEAGEAAARLLVNQCPVCYIFRDFPFAIITIGFHASIIERCATYGIEIVIVDDMKARSL